MPPVGLGGRHKKRTQTIDRSFGGKKVTNVVYVTTTYAESFHAISHIYSPCFTSFMHKSLTLQCLLFLFFKRHCCLTEVSCAQRSPKAMCRNMPTMSWEICFIQKWQFTMVFSFIACFHYRIVLKCFKKPLITDLAIRLCGTQNSDDREFLIYWSSLSLMFQGLEIGVLDLVHSFGRRKYCV